MKNRVTALFRKQSLRLKQSIDKTRAKAKAAAAEIGATLGALPSLAQQPIPVRVKTNGKSIDYRR